jgi:hypothetical protein
MVRESAKSLGVSAAKNKLFPPVNGLSVQIVLHKENFNASIKPSLGFRFAQLF